jgi:hypothetical protein
MGASEASWLGGRGDLFVGRVGFSAFLGGLGGRLLLLLLLRLLLLLGGLVLALVHVQCGVERDVRVWREDVCHRWSRCTDQRAPSPSCCPPLSEHVITR